MRRTVRLPLFGTIVAAGLLLRPTLALATEYWASVDDYDRPLPTSGYYFHRMGGNRGTIKDVLDPEPSERDFEYSWDGNSAYTAKCVRVSAGATHSFGGMWSSLI